MATYMFENYNIAIIEYESYQNLIIRVQSISYLEIMKKKITGSISKEINNIKKLKLFLLNRNRLTGSLAEELGGLPNLENNLDRREIHINTIA
ncbi:hypothetical protein C5167_020724 [Papaver somniferum]|uniref:Uncharacterized protein n=1 Tax=Papaver somniferum TaxID=3469 RepID=A0A4Y7IX56_PAPSO|nr:hypothetical protein C5167_020724 [Papaver somniferum]